MISSRIIQFYPDTPFHKFQRGNIYADTVFFNMKFFINPPSAVEKPEKRDRSASVAGTH